MNWTLKEKEQISFIKKSSVEVLIKENDSDGVPWLKTVFALYKKIYSQPCYFCAGNIPHYIKQIKSYAMKKEEKNIKNSVNRKYLFRDKVVITPFGTNTPYNNKNLTDKKAIELLRGNPNRIVLFKKYPKNWKDVLKNITEFKIVELEEKVKACTDTEELQRWLEEEKAAEIPRKGSIAHITTRLKELETQLKEEEELKEEEQLKEEERLKEEEQPKEKKQKEEK